jgi:hypothetical protein
MRIQGLAPRWAGAPAGGAVGCVEARRPAIIHSSSGTESHRATAVYTEDSRLGTSQSSGRVRGG